MIKHVIHRLYRNKQEIEAILIIKKKFKKLIMM